MKNRGTWKQFERTGDILDYLNYTACTCETSTNTEQGYNANKVGDYNVDVDSSDRNGFISHANWGLR
ncbi:MAG TPA: hypothetical protein GXZ90_06595 [Clostridiales bacterium]|nr:hypothetical protein [Clostridiales bacterium]